MLKHKYFMVSALAIALLSSCADSETTPPPTTSQPVATTSTNTSLPTIKVGTDANYPPFQYRDEKHNILGIESDLLKSIGKSQGLNMELEHFIRQNYHDTLKSGHFDMWSSAFYGNAEYPDDIAITKPFMDAYIVVGVCDEKEGNN